MTLAPEGPIRTSGAMGHRAVAVQLQGATRCRPGVDTPHANALSRDTGPGSDRQTAARPEKRATRAARSGAGSMPDGATDQSTGDADRRAGAPATVSTGVCRAVSVSDAESATRAVNVEESTPGGVSDVSSHSDTDVAAAELPAGEDTAGVAAAEDGLPKLRSELQRATAADPVLTAVINCIESEGTGSAEDLASQVCFIWASDSACSCEMVLFIATKMERVCHRFSCLKACDIMYFN